MESSKLKQTRHSSTTDLIKYLGVGRDWLETEVPTLRDVLRKGLHIQENLLLLTILIGEFFDTILISEFPYIPSGHRTPDDIHRTSIRLDVQCPMGRKYYNIKYFKQTIL